jgi:hypothetical protein
MKTVKRKDGYWITGVPECDIVGPYETKSEAEDDRVGLERTEKNMDKRAFWTCEKNVQPITPVLLRKDKSGGELFALFPEEDIDGVPEHCKCYNLSSEGYAAADYTKCMRISKAATTKESEKILAALRKLKWKNLKVIKRATSLTHAKRGKKQ